MTIELTDEQISVVLQGIKLPPQPQILVDLQIEFLMSGDDTSRVKFLIAQDVSLAGIVLKFANATLAKADEPVISIFNAVELLGKPNVSRIVMGLSEKGAKGELTDATIVALTRFWDLAADMALVSKLIAEKIGFRDPDIAYVLGLFHNAGMPLMLLRFENYLEIMKEGYHSDSGSTVDAENAHFSTNHETIGYYASKSWGLPKYLGEIIANHHNVHEIFEMDDNAEKKTLLAILKLSGYICGEFSVLGGQPEDKEWLRICRDVMDHVEMSSYEVAELEEALNDRGVNTIGRFD